MQLDGEFPATPEDTPLVRARGIYVVGDVILEGGPQVVECDRPKVGFSVPLAEWLRGPLRGWAEDLLDAQKLARGGVLASEPIRNEWRALQDGSSANALRLWTVLMFQAWHDARMAPDKEYAVQYA